MKPQGNFSVVTNWEALEKGTVDPKIVDAIRLTAEAATRAALEKFGFCIEPAGEDIDALKTRWKAEFGLKIRAQRDSRGLSQGAFAKAIGIQQAHLSQLEGGKLDARFSTIYGLARALGVKPSQILPSITSP
jgi:DNA-binding XRE family transcriptional regulator